MSGGKRQSINEIWKYTIALMQTKYAGNGGVKDDIGMEVKRFAAGLISGRRGGKVWR